MLRIFKILMLTSILSCSYADDLKVTLLDKVSVNYSNGIFTDTQFRILCINGYKWLQFGVNNSSSASQMFESNVITGNATPIKCENK